jgi:mono/diheme cytochrome c family protein
MFGVAQEKEKTGKKGPNPNVTPASAEETFKSYCAAGHGKDAKGAGPATVDLKSTPPDLTHWRSVTTENFRLIMFRTCFAMA